MSDTSSSDASERKIEASEQEPLWLRFIYMLGFGVLAHIAFSLALFLGVVQVVLLLVRKEMNDELLAFSRSLIVYIGECLAFITFARDDKPFRLAKFPSVES
jgi:hypothetical protein